MPGFSLNMIRVGSEAFTGADEVILANALMFTQNLYGTVGVVLRKVENYFISMADAGSYTVIDTESEAISLTAQWTVPNTGIDVFIVRSWPGTLAGKSPVGGPCDKNLPFPNMTGVVIELNGTDTNTVLAHELGHYLGLSHETTDGTNLMFIVSPNGGRLRFDQGEIMKKHCSMQP